MVDFNEIVDPGVPFEPTVEPPEPREWKCRLAGVTFEGRQKNIERYALANARYRLVRQPDNPYDTNAVMVTANGRDVGHVPNSDRSGRIADQIAPLIDAGCNLRVHFVRKLVNDKDLTKPTGLMVRIWEG